MGSLQMWKPLYLSPTKTFDENCILSKSKQRHRDFQEYLVPELSIIHPFPSSFFFKVMCLPTILFRLNGLLLAEELRGSVAREVQVGTIKLSDDFSWQTFYLETSDKALVDYLFGLGQLKEKPNNKIIPCDIVKDITSNEITSFEVEVDLKTHTGPSPSLILQALTAKSAGDEFNLERKLTNLRSRLIQNLHLYQKAKKKKLGQYLTTTLFIPSKTWLPPCYIVEDHVDEKNLVKKKKKKEAEKEDEKTENPLHLYFTKQVISDKCVADSVEALIGTYLLSSGQMGALKFMAWFGLNPFLDDEVNYDHWPPPPPNPIVGDHPHPEFRLEVLSSGFDRFEEIIGYTFRNKAYLLQAFTHPSYSDNNITDCYQRLEFLGDAILDYLITRQLYEDPSDHSPGKLTDLRAALVNNIYFASLAVTYKYNNFLKMLSPSLFNLMNYYINMLKESDAFKFLR
ncbi:endoribonuclease Dcr-1 [Caerostris extrusa]|uniref:Endoribonuclease Dcr-1 n=1 Tax=Caerostris extrusa TaxID=172846 RepID=A0AAV4S309_CAEEX|nr:endoribonuclease Dcr-1 [Caerostris extrusa]